MSADRPMMGCGHAANATHNGQPCCVICFGIHKGASTIAETPDLNGRTAKCASCKNSRPSNVNLAFFEWRPTKAEDLYYCGCQGWD